MLVALMLGVGAPAAAHAQTVLYVSSSLIPTCVTPSCSQVYFYLSMVPPAAPAFIKSFTINATGGWVFGNPALVQILDMNGTNVTGLWTVGLTNGQLTVNAVNLNQPTTMQPLLITANFGAAGGSVGTQSQLMGFTYSGQACYKGNCFNSNPPDVGFQGTASPEPVTVLLLGTGLAGVAALKLRRRKKGEANYPWHAAQPEISG